jgi:hypothetical protein
MALKYKVGDIFLIPFEVTNTDSTDNPYRLSLPNDLVLDELQGGHWFTEDELDQVKEFADPDLKRQRIQKQIDDLQEQLAAIK